VKLGEAIRLFSANFIWRASGARFAGRALIDGLTSPDENNRLIAGMLLARGRHKAAPLFREALDSGAVSPLLLRVIGDSGIRDFEDVLERYATCPDPRLAHAAGDALRVLRMGAPGGR
jgi:hypothetical protein